MRHLTWFIMGVLLATLALGLGMNMAMAQDIAKMSLQMGWFNFLKNTRNGRLTRYRRHISAPA